MPKRTNIKIPPIKKIAYNHFPFSVKVFLTLEKNSLNGIGLDFDFGLLTNTITMITEMVQKTGNEKKGKNQINPASKEPKIGLRTLPNVLEVSIKPRQLLTSSSFLNMSPTKGKDNWHSTSCSHSLKGTAD